MIEKVDETEMHETMLVLTKGLKTSNGTIGNSTWDEVVSSYKREYNSNAPQYPR